MAGMCSPEMHHKQASYQQLQQLPNPCDADSIRQALAIAIVREKRKCRQEADGWRAKAQALETSNTAIRAWATSLLQKTTESTSQDPTVAVAAAAKEIKACPGQNHSTSMFLPPMTISSEHKTQQHPTAPALQASYTNLQKQLLLAAQPTSCTGAASVLSGKAAALSGMLLTNIHMLQQLHHPDKSLTSSTAAATKPLLSSSLQQTPTTDTMSALGSFIEGTLLQVPNSSLRRAYMQQCAALLAALLSQPRSDTVQQQETYCRQQPAAPAGQPLQQLMHKEQSSRQGDLVAVQAVGLMLMLLQRQMNFSAVHDLKQQQQKPPSPAPAACSSQQAAKAMLQQLSSFPGTALLMALSVAQQLQQHVQRLQHANTTVETVQLGVLSSSRLAAGERALDIAADLFEASYQLIEELEQAIQRLPAWVVVLSSNSWTVKALEDLVSITASMYSCCPALQQHQYLLADKLCQLVAGLATALQHLATAADAPGMRSSSGAALRSACGGLCMQLRDVFMPAGLQQQSK